MKIEFSLITAAVIAVVLFSGKSTARNAVAIPKQVLLSTVTAFIAVRAKFSSGKQLKINGRRIGGLQTKYRKDFVRKSRPPERARSRFSADSNGGEPRCAKQSL